MEDGDHLVKVLENVRKAIAAEDIAALKELSNETIHAASIHQDTGNITVAVIVYAIGKLLERRENLKIKNWSTLIRKIDSQFALAVKAVKEDNLEKYEKYMEMSRKTISSTSLNMRPYVQEVLRKASINKASKIYEHGISLGQTAKMLGVTEWELSEYAGQTKVAEVSYNATITTAKRAKLAMEFFS